MMSASTRRKHYSDIWHTYRSMKCSAFEPRQKRRIANQIGEIVEADARDLSRWGDASFDAVLSLGPFYHLPDRLDRS